MEYTVSKYSCITKENIDQFNKRVIVFNCSQGSTLEVENSVLTLENIVEFYEAFEAMKIRFKDSRLTKKEHEDICTLVYKWILNFLSENKKIKEVEYIYSKVSLSNLVEVSILFTNEMLNECSQQ